MSAHAQPAIGVVTYLLVGLALLALLGISYALAHVPGLGIWSPVIGLSLATLKMLLVVTFFMHLKVSSPLVRVFSLVGALFVGILIALTLGDVLTRDWLG